MRAREFDRREITPETKDLVWFIIYETSALRAIKQKFSKVVHECGGVMNVPGKYWALIENLAYSAGGSVQIVPMPKKCAKTATLVVNKKPITVDTVSKKITFESIEDEIDEEEEDVLTQPFDAQVNALNDAGAGVEVHTQVDNYIQQAMAPRKPLKTVPLPQQTPRTVS